MPREKPGDDHQRRRELVPREPEPIRTQAPKPNARDRHGAGLAGQDSPGTRSGEGSDSVMDQMQKDEQRNANHSEGQGEERDSTS